MIHNLWVWRSYRGTCEELTNDLSNTVNYAFNLIMPQTSNDSNAVQPIASTCADPEKEEIRLKLAELINALRR